MQDPEFFCRLYAIIIIALSAICIRRRFKSGSLLTCVGGLHANMLIFCGVGPLCYTLYTSEIERIPIDVLFISIEEGGRWLLIGYAFCVLWELRRLPHAQALQVKPGNLPLYALVVAGVTGYFGSLMDFSTSGAGIVFPVLKGFYYPAVVFAMLRCNRRNLVEIFFTGLLIILGLALSIASPWRSELLMFFGCVGIGILLRLGRGLLPFTVIVCVFLFVLLPFQNEKRMNYEETMKDPWKAFVKSQGSTLKVKSDFLLQFCGLRINALRELAYVDSGLKRGAIEPRYGLSYVETLLQLVPRVLWKEKPFYNQIANHTLPQDVGLVAAEDEDTSWGVNLFAEFVWNFTSLPLLIFVPITFLLFSLMDRFVVYFLHNNFSQKTVLCVFFFLNFQMVSLVSAGTYFLWTLVFVWLSEKGGRLVMKLPHKKTLQRI